MYIVNFPLYFFLGGGRELWGEERIGIWEGGGGGREDFFVN